MEMSQACKRFDVDMNDPNSDVYRCIDNLKNEIESRNQLIEMLSSYIETLSIEDFDLFAKSELIKLDQNLNCSVFVLSVCRVARKLLEEESDLIDTSVDLTHYYKGYVFGSKFSEYWFAKNTSNIQLDLF